MSDEKKLPIYKRGFSSAALRNIALLFMLIDHIGVVMGRNYSSQTSLDISRTLHIAGRISFPLFCFLIVQGVLHTSNIKKYFTRLASFALISELFFDIFRYNKNIYWYFVLKKAYVLAIFQSQNVFFTLLLGALLIYFAMQVEKAYPLEKAYLLKLLLLIGFSLIADFIGSDYGYYGILLIFTFYQFRNQKWLLCLVTILINVALYNGSIQVYSVISLLFILNYNKKRGFYHPRLKMLFYYFYPIHIGILGIIDFFLNTYKG